MPRELLARIRAAILEHVQRDHPKEACGFVVNARGQERYYPGRNLGDKPHEMFYLEDWWRAEEQLGGEIIAVVHSHPNGSANASDADRTACEETGVPWHIVGWPSGVWTTIEPIGWRAPLVGRRFAHGVLDCYTLIRDYYRERLGLELPDFARTDDWWLRGEDLYRKGFAAAGFSEASDLQLHDVVLLRLPPPGHPERNVDDNHAGVYIGDNLLLHHPYGRLSCREPYGGYWRDRTKAYLRHL